MARDGKCTVPKLREALLKQHAGVYPGIWRMRKHELCEALAKKSSKQKSDSQTNKQSTSTRTIAIKEENPFIWKPTTKYISGALSVTVYQAPEGKKIYMFGDMHLGSSLQCWSKSRSESVEDLIDGLCQDPKGRDVDVCLENATPDYFYYGSGKPPKYSWTNPYGKLQEYFPSPMVKLIDKYHHDMFHDVHTSSKRCKARFNRIDARDDSYLLNILTPRAILRKYWTLSKFKKIVFELCTSTRHKSCIIAKEFHKLTHVEQAAAYKQLEVIFDQSLNTVSFQAFLAELTVITGVLQRNTLSINIMAIMFAVFIEFYTLCRLMRVLRKQKPGGVSIIFWGDTHAFHFRKVLTSLYGKPLVYATAASTMQLRCVKIA